MPAGVSWGQYMKYLSAAMLSMMAGSQLVHLYYKPLNDINVYIEREMKAAKSQNADEKPPDGKILPSKS